MLFADAIEEEPATYADAATGGPKHAFDPALRGLTSEDEQRDSGATSKNCSRSPRTASLASGEDRSPVEHRTPPTPFLDKSANASSTYTLEKAIPSHHVDIKNPLTQPEFRSQSHGSSVSASRTHSRNPSHNSSVIASPCAESPKCDSSSAASWGMREIGLSPFFEGASPFCEAAAALSGTEIASPRFPHQAPSPSDKVSIRILNGVSGEEEVRFPMTVEASFSEQHFYSMLDRLCQKHAGQALCDMNWLSQAHPNARFQRRQCDLSMVEELFGEDVPSQRKGPAVLLLCTVPAKPPSELPANKVRLRNIMPSRVSAGAVQPVRMQVDTSLLEACATYSVAFTHQWTNVTYTVDATLLPTGRGVEVCVPWQIIAAAGSNTDGLYDVHIVTDCSYRSENRRTLTVGSAESEFSSSSTAMSTAQSSFVPLNRGGATPCKA